MNDRDPKRELAVDVVRRLTEAGFQALWAGGCVRDFLMGRRPQDYDVATDAHPDQVRQVFGHRRTLAVGASFGVIIVRGRPQSGDVEVATFRTEGPYLDGRRPSQVAFSSPEEDARRRDFTINGMFYDPLTQNVLDFVGGEKDLGAGVVRAIGDPRARMAEDKLRMLRAVRFAAALEFEIDPQTATAVRGMADEILVVSAERIAQEFKKMLVDRHRARAIELARDMGLIVRILPELADALSAHSRSAAGSEWQCTLHMLDRLQQPGFELAASVLLQAVSPLSGEHANAGAVQAADPGQQADSAREICRRLRLSNRETDEIGWLLEHRHALAKARELSPARLKRILAHPWAGELLHFFRVETLARNADLAPVVYCEEYLRNTPREEINPPPLISGDDLIARGLPPGPHFGQLLENVRDAQLNNEIRTPEEAFLLVDRLLAGGSRDDRP